MNFLNFCILLILLGPRTIILSGQETQCPKLVKKLSVREKAVLVLYRIKNRFSLKKSLATSIFLGTSFILYWRFLKPNNQDDSSVPNLNMLNYSENKITKHAIETYPDKCFLKIDINLQEFAKIHKEAVFKSMKTPFHRWALNKLLNGSSTALSIIKKQFFNKLQNGFDIEKIINHILNTPELLIQKLDVLDISKANSKSGLFEKIADENIKKELITNKLKNCVCALRINIKKKSSLEPADIEALLIEKNGKLFRYKK